MKLSLGDTEIRQAISDYVEKQGIVTVDKTISVDIKSGRKGNGYSAVINIDPIQDKQPDTEVKKGENEGEDSTSLFKE